MTELAETENERVIDRLLQSDAVSGFTQVAHNQLVAWREQLDLLRDACRTLIVRHPDLAGAALILEYRIPRREKRIDVVLLLGRTVVLLEFKVGAARDNPADVVQIVDYALDIAYYHLESRDRKIQPILCPTLLEVARVAQEGLATHIEPLIICGASNLLDVLTILVAGDRLAPGPMLDAGKWVKSAYRPIPGVIEATLRLFRAHQVEDIRQSLAGHDLIDNTVKFIEGVVRRSRSEGQKFLCLLTGVPGAGKTLAGLQIAHLEEVLQSDWRCVFVSGNGPLLRVLKAALTKDYAERQGVPLTRAKPYAESLLHSVHAYLAEARPGQRAPAERIVVFDEAQRAWDAAKMQRMSNRAVRMGGVEKEHDARSNASEPWQILEVLDRHSGGAVLVALCGNGQEIHDGEAGVGEWLRAREVGFPQWKVVCSPVAAELARSAADVGLVEVKDELHLDVPIRAHRAALHSKWIDAVLSSRPSDAAACVDDRALPLRLTRDLEDAREWLWRSTLGSRRCGLLASSGGARLRPYGVEVSADFRKGVEYATWFTGERSDLRSSFALEVAATEFECQGLELDWVGLCWSWDMPIIDAKVVPRKLRANNSWAFVKTARERAYYENKYRVLLSRAREGMVIWVPKGLDHDITRSPREADCIADYLLACGVEPL